MESAAAQHNQELRGILQEYREWDLMREMGYTPQEMDAVPGHLVTKWMRFMGAERLGKKWAHEDVSKGR